MVTSFLIGGCYYHPASLAMRNEGILYVHAHTRRFLVERDRERVSRGSSTFVDEEPATRRYCRRKTREARSVSHFYARRLLFQTGKYSDKVGIYDMQLQKNEDVEGIFSFFVERGLQGVGAPTPLPTQTQTTIKQATKTSEFLLCKCSTSGLTAMVSVATQRVASLSRGSMRTGCVLLCVRCKRPFSRAPLQQHNENSFGLQERRGPGAGGHKEATVNTTPA